MSHQPLMHIVQISPFVAFGYKNLYRIYVKRTFKTRFFLKILLHLSSSESPCGSKLLCRSFVSK